MKLPPKLDWVANLGKPNEHRIVCSAERISSTAPPELAIKKTTRRGLPPEYIRLRLTAKRARAWAKWLLRYAETIEKLPEQGAK